MNVDAQLVSLYPHLAEPGLRAAEPTALLEGLLDAVRLKAADSVAVKQHLFALEAARIVQAARLLAKCFRIGGKLDTLGNGGSSCDAAHLAVEFQHPVTAGRPALPAVNLSQDMAMITAVGNDLGFAHVYTRQVLAHVGERDCVVAISTSGNSENLLAGLAAAKRRGATTLGLAGGSGGRMAESSALDLCLVVPTDSIHRVQETHVALYHISDLTHTLLGVWAAEARCFKNPHFWGSLHHCLGRKNRASAILEPRIFPPRFRFLLPPRLLADDRAPDRASHGVLL